MHKQPTPFTLVKREGAPSVATNGTTALVCLDAGGIVMLRRGITGEFGAPTAEKILPHLNALAGELLANSAMPPLEVAARLHALQLACKPPEFQNTEWAFAELDGVRVYVDGSTVVVTRQDLPLGKALGV